jgi:tRNA (guanine6-N2)-methyltransferase
MPRSRRSTTRRSAPSHDATRRRPPNPRPVERRAQSVVERRFEAEVLPGLAPFAVAELERLGATVSRVEEDAVEFRFGGPLEALSGLRRCVAVYLLLRFEVPRPKALLGHEHLTRLMAELDELRAGPGAPSYDGFRIGAAGSDSKVFARLAQEVSARSGLAHRPDDGELLLRVRPRDGAWEVLLRSSERPLSARSWRACNMPGGLNATVAAAAHDLLGASPADRYLNLMCGSGTLLVERALAADWARGVGIDIDERSLACAGENIAAAGLAGGAELLPADATDLPFDDGEFDRLSADLPWGDVVGTHRENARLYPRFLAEAARVGGPGARLVVVTHELRLFEAALAGEPAWRQTGLVRVFHGGHRPGVYVLERAG